VDEALSHLNVGAVPGNCGGLPVLNANRLVYDDNSQTRTLLPVADVTEARASDKIKDNLLREKDDLLREKAVLLQEVQHRIANSLQNIASILMQCARKVLSDETSVHLRNALGRLMSIAAVQSQLSRSSLGDVELHPYFAQLCRSLGASTINARWDGGLRHNWATRLWHRRNYCAQFRWLNSGHG
jgi:two-component system, sensor histidine kinase PdtaS